MCLDLNGTNILKNLIPFNYSSSGYSMSLAYKYDNELKNVGWLLSKSDLIDKIGDDNIKFGGALIDAKNGVVTFYDVDGNKQDIFPDISSNFYLTATKYIGLSDVKKLRSLDVIKNLSVSGEATFGLTPLDISEL